MRASTRSVCRFTVLLMATALWLGGCDGSPSGGGSSGGTKGSGGATSSGGGSGSGGSGGSGGMTGSGGTTGASGGSSASSGGSPASSGGSSAASGGDGMTTGSGGAAASGGSPGGGGRSAATSSGGVSGSAGATGTAGGSGNAGRSGGSGSGGAAAGGSSGGQAPAKPSAGCMAATAPTAGRTMIDVSGTKREYILTLPAGYDAHHPYPLIVAFHGGQYNDDWLVSGDKPQSGPYYGIQSEAKDTAIFVASQALSGSWTNDNNRDIDYVLAMVTLFKSQLCIDENRIFATGFSMGGIMTNTVACTQPTLFRAVAAMSGKFPTTPATCTPSHTIAYWASHGMSDTTIDIKNGQMVRDKFASTNHCTGPGSTADANGCTTYQGCDAGYPVVWCPFAGIHEPAPFAGAAVWKFLSQF